MQYTQLGNSEVSVSRICMGCMGFGEAAAGMHAWTLPEEESRAVIRAGLEAGVNLFDTALSHQDGPRAAFLGPAVPGFAPPGGGGRTSRGGLGRAGGRCLLARPPGVRAGRAPAYRAMAIKPIEAIRDE